MDARTTPATAIAIARFTGESKRGPTTATAACAIQRLASTTLTAAIATIRWIRIAIATSPSTRRAIATRPTVVAWIPTAAPAATAGRDSAAGPPTISPRTTSPAIDATSPNRNRSTRPIRRTAGPGTTAAQIQNPLLVGVVPEVRDATSRTDASSGAGSDVIGFSQDQLDLDPRHMGRATATASTGAQP
jgi:hypothetical protein